MSHDFITCKVQKVADVSYELSLADEPTDKIIVKPFNVDDFQRRLEFM